jgi:hypothetical protein
MTGLANRDQVVSFVVVFVVIDVVNFDRLGLSTNNTMIAIPFGNQRTQLFEKC